MSETKNILTWSSLKTYLNTIPVDQRFSSTDLTDHFFDCKFKTNKSNNAKLRLYIFKLRAQEYLQTISTGVSIRVKYIPAELKSSNVDYKGNIK